MCDVEPGDLAGAALRIATEECPRCGTIGLLEVDAAELDTLPAADWFEPPMHLTGPEWHVQCPGCRLASLWPAMSLQPQAA